MNGQASFSTSCTFTAIKPHSCDSRMHPGSPGAGTGSGFPSSGKTTPKIFFVPHMYGLTSSACGSTSGWLERKRANGQNIPNAMVPLNFVNSSVSTLDFFFLS